jgi:hypothetical protein
MKFVLADTACVYRLCRSHGAMDWRSVIPPKPILTHDELEGWEKEKGKEEEMEEERNSTTELKWVREGR